MIFHQSLVPAKIPSPNTFNKLENFGHSSQTKLIFRIPPLFYSAFIFRFHKILSSHPLSNAIRILNCFFNILIAKDLVSVYNYIKKMFISRQASYPSNHLPEHSFSQDLGLDSIIDSDSKVANESATTNSPSYDDIDSPNIFPIVDLEEQEQVRRIRERIEGLKEQKQKMDMRFKGYIKNLEGNLFAKEQLNRRLKQEIKSLRSECNETTKDIQIIRKHLKKDQVKKQITTEKEYGKYTLSKHLYTQTTHKRKPSNLTKISTK